MHTYVLVFALESQIEIVTDQYMGMLLEKNNHHHMKAHLPQLTIIEFFSHLID